MLQPDKPFHKKIIPRLSFKSNLVALVFSLVGQHYHLTLKHSLKKTQLEPAVRAYTEKQLKAWNEKKHSFRAKLFKPLQPTFERWAKSLQKRGAEKRDRRVNEFHSGLLSSTVGFTGLQDWMNRLSVNHDKSCQHFIYLVGRSQDQRDLRTHLRRTKLHFNIEILSGEAYLNV